jgi:hypothetical protein
MRTDPDPDDDLVSLRSLERRYRVHRDTLCRLCTVEEVRIYRFPAPDGRLWRYVTARGANELRVRIELDRLRGKPWGRRKGSRASASRRGT